MEECPIAVRLENLYKDVVAVSQVLKSDVDTTWTQVVDPEIPKLNGKSEISPQICFAVKRIIRRFNDVMARASEDLCILNEQMLIDVQKRIPVLKLKDLRTKEVKSISMTIGSSSEEEKESPPNRKSRRRKIKTESFLSPEKIRSKQSKNGKSLISEGDSESDADSSSSQKTVFFHHGKHSRRTVSLNQPQTSSTLVFTSSDDEKSTENSGKGRITKLESVPSPPKTVVLPTRVGSSKVKSEKSTISPNKSAPIVESNDDNNRSSSPSMLDQSVATVVIGATEKSVDTSKPDDPSKSVETVFKDSDEDIFAPDSTFNEVATEDAMTDNLSVKSEELEEIPSQADDNDNDWGSVPVSGDSSAPVSNDNFGTPTTPTHTVVAEDNDDSSSEPAPAPEENENTSVTAPVASRKTTKKPVNTEKPTSSKKICKADKEAKKALLESDSGDSSDSSDFTPKPKRSSKGKKVERKDRSRATYYDKEKLIKEARESKTEVYVEPLDDKTLAVLQEHGSISYMSYSDSGKTKNSRSKTKDKTIEKINRLTRGLKNFNPIITSSNSESEDDGTRSTRNKSKNKGTPKKSKEASFFDERSSDSDDDNANKRSSRNSRSQSKSKFKEFTRTNSDASADDSDLSASSDDNSHDGGKKKRSNRGAKHSSTSSKKYFTPKVTLSSDSEELELKQIKKGLLDTSDSHSDSGSEKPVKRSVRGRKRRIASQIDSDGVGDANFMKIKKEKSPGTDSEERDKSPELVELSSGSEDFSVKKKTRKRRKKSSSESEEEEGSKKSKKKKTTKRKRRRVKNFSDSDSDSDKSNKDDDEDVKLDSQGTPTKPKKIRKILNKRDLQKSTLDAEKEEEDRRKRLAERQKLFNDEFTLPESGTYTSLVLDRDPETKEILVQVDPAIVRHLKEHQVKGIKFLYDTCFESTDAVKANSNKGTGGILAHCMGLGKTLQSVAFMHTALTHQCLKTFRILVLCPLNTVDNWFHEIRHWTEDAAKSIKIHKLWEGKTNASRTDDLKFWMNKGGVGIMNYDLFRLLVGGSKKKAKASQLKTINEALVDPGADIVICDEGHLLKNHTTKLSKTINTIATRKRLVLTGTPLQNHLVEYYTMMHFVKPNLLGTLSEFRNRFVNPIKQGQHLDSTEYEVKRMKRRAHVLHKLLEGCVQRMDYSVLKPYLPPKYEYVININLSDMQKKLYQHYLDNFVNIERRRVINDYATFIKIVAHPIVLTMGKDDDSDATSSTGSLRDFIVDGSTPEDTDSDTAEASTSSATAAKRRTRSMKTPLEEQVELDGNEPKRGWWSQYFSNQQDMYDVNLSGKLVVLQSILKTCEEIGDKVLVFSQFLTSLDLIEEFLEDWDKEAKKSEERLTRLTFPSNLNLQSSAGRWRKNIEFYRIDGATKVGDRHRHCQTFNKKNTATSSASRAKLFLISTKAGGLGINLFGANRVVLFDASWNPSQDMQSIFRVYRFGQDKPCYIYRFLARGTMEEKIYRRQIVKLSTAHRVVDEHQIERHFKFDDVNELYKFEPGDSNEDRPTPPVPKDKLLADLMISLDKWMYSYFEHDSLLQNQMDEQLTQEEMQAAWDEYKSRSDERPKMNQPTTILGLSIPYDLYLHSSVLIDVHQKLKQRFQGTPDSVFNELFNVCKQKMELLLNLTNFIQNHGDTMEPIRRATFQRHETQLKEAIVKFLNDSDAPDIALRNLIINTTFPNMGVSTNTMPLIRNLNNMPNAPQISAQFQHLGQSVVGNTNNRTGPQRTWANVVPYNGAVGSSRAATAGTSAQARAAPTVTAHPSVIDIE